MSYPKQQYVPVQQRSMKYAPAQDKDEVFRNAIRMCNIDGCKELMDADSEILHRKGWNQITPLHQACLSGQLGIVSLFLEQGANPNVRNSFEETPLHYACRRGVVSVVHMMIKNGADTGSVDKKGRNCMHFAALGGSVVTLHYLRSHTDLNFDTPDDTGRNSLHVSCELRQFACVCYLIKHNRVDPGLKDLRGVTPLHIAIEKGYGDMAWLVLKAGGSELLQIQNQKGETPLDLAKNGGSEHYQVIFKTLLSYSNKKGPPRGPVFTWYFLMFLPFCYLALVFLLTKYMNSYGGHFMLLMSLILAYLASKQSHRIDHICRWPNPIFMGTFVGGVAHCAIADFGHLQRALWPCPILTVIVTSVAAVVIYLLWYLLCMDPGTDTSPIMCSSTNRPMSVLDIAEGRVSENRFCPFSEMLHGEDTKYCRLCERPMLNLDHHCLFLNNCVAKNNHKHFIMMLLLVMLLQVSFVYSSCIYMQMHAEQSTSDGLGDPITPYLSYLYRNDPWIFCLTLLCVFSFLWEAPLVYSQLSVVMKGTTTYRTIKHQNPNVAGLTVAQMLRNLVKFFMQPTTSVRYRAVKKEVAPLLDV